MTYTKTNEPLDILVSARIRLNPEERANIKQAYQKVRAGYAPKQQASVNGSSIVVETPQFTVETLDKELGMSHMIFADLINSRDSLSIPVILRIQKVLGVEVVTRKRLEAATKRYLDYIFSKVEEDGNS
jgi:hypothetical protein